jgi:hypothetical protein
MKRRTIWAVECYANDGFGWLSVSEFESREEAREYAKKRRDSGRTRVWPYDARPPRKR